MKIAKMRAVSVDAGFLVNRLEVCGVLVAPIDLFDDERLHDVTEEINQAFAAQARHIPAGSQPAAEADPPQGR